jgi:hypothetical protein
MSALDAGISAPAKSANQPKWSWSHDSSGRSSFRPIASAMSWKVIPSSPTA